MFQSKRQGAVDVISGESPIGQETLENLENIVDPFLLKGQPRIVLDLSEVPLIDSKGLEYLLDLNDACVARGGALRLAGPNNLCNDIIEVCEVASHVAVYKDTTSAVGGFSQ